MVGRAWCLRRRPSPLMGSSGVAATGREKIDREGARRSEGLRTAMIVDDGDPPISGYGSGGVWRTEEREREVSEGATAR